MDKCYICLQPLAGTYHFDVWDHKMCASHYNKDVIACSSCYGFTKKDNILPDGRILCKVCFDTAIKPGDSVESVKASVINNLNRVGFDDLRIEDITIEIVSAQKLAEIRKSPINLQNKGITMSKTTTATSFGFFTGKNTRQTFRHRVYMLTHLTKIEFAGTLAHELLHAWQVQNGINMSPKMTEGVCNMGTYLMYTSLPGSLTKILLKSLNESNDPIYGDGFREVFTIYNDIGWSELIMKIRKKDIV